MLKKGIAPLLVIFFFSNMAQSESIIDKIINFFDEPKVEAVDLLNPPTEIPGACDDSQELINEYTAFVGHVNVCTDLMQNEPSTVSFFEANKCINNIGAQFAEISEQACKDVFLTGSPGGIADIYRMVLNTYFDNVVLTPAGGGDFDLNWDNGLEVDDVNYVGFVEDYFSLVGSWYRQTRGEVYPSDSGTLVISQAQGLFLETEILKKFWDGVQAYAPEWKATFGQITLVETEEAQTEKLFEIFNALLEINERVIAAAYRSELAAELYDWVDGDPSPGPSPVLAALIGDTLGPFYERVRTLTKIYDIACKLNSCDDEFYDLNETVWMLRFFDNLGQGTIIDEFVFDEDDVRPLSNFIRTLYQVRIPKKRLIDKMNDVFGVTNIANILPGSDFPHFLESFHKVFAESHDFNANYEATKEVKLDGTVKAGFFHGGNISEINVGFGRVNMDLHISAVKTVNDQLIVLSDSFKGLHNQIINQTLAINSTQIQLNQLEDRINIDVTDMMNLKNQIDAIRNFIFQERERFASKVGQVISNLGSSAETFTKIGGTVTTVVPASSSNQGSGGTSWPTIGRIPLGISNDILRGDMLRITVDGEYEPTCAIQGTYGATVAKARTGPRGFNLNFVNGKSKVQSTNRYKTNEIFASNTTTVSVCGGIPGIGTTLFGAEAKTCNETSFGARTSSGTTTSDTNSESTRSDASFDLGLTLANTPFPTSPAGALLLVEMPIGETNKNRYKTLKTLNRASSIIAGSESSSGPGNETDYFLVVNDCLNPSGVGELTVSIEHFRSSGTLAQEFIDKVQAILPKLEENVAGLVENGVLSQQTLAALRGELAGSITGGTELTSFTGNIRILLEAFLDSEMNILNFKSQISAMERQLEMKKQNLNSLVDHYGEENQQKFLRVSQRNWNLANLDLDFVNTEGTNRNLFTLNRVIDILEHNLVSYLDFRYDEERKRAIVGNINLLNRLNFASPFDDIALSITTFMTALLNNLQDDINNRPVTPKMTMGIHIPNPHYVKPVGFPDPVFNFPQMDSFRAQQLWDAIYAWKRGEDGAEIKFDVIFDDLYQKLGLGCYVEAPIIDSIGMYFIPENEGFITDFNNMYRHRNAKIHLEGLSFIPFENNARQYNFVNPEWRFMDFAVRMAKSPRDAMNRLTTEFPPSAQVDTGLSTGRSPFGFFEIGDIPAYSFDEGTSTAFLGDTPLDEIKELFIAYTFAASNNDFNVNLGWLEDYCGENGTYWDFLAEQGLRPGEDMNLVR